MKDLISSPDNPRFRELKGLLESPRDRRKAGRTVLDGVHLVKACRQAGVVPLQLVVSQSGRQKPEIVGELSAHPALEPLVLADGLFDRLSTVTTATGILAEIAVPRPGLDPATAGPCILLEDIQDPGNLGSILRSTTAAGIGEVYLSRACADAWSPKVLRAGMGAHFHLGLHEDVDLAAFAATYPGTVVALDQRAAWRLQDTDLTGRVALLLGNEGAGLTPALKAAAGVTVAIPMPGPTESLGVAAAAAICLFERVRQLSGHRTETGPG